MTKEKIKRNLVPFSDDANDYYTYKYTREASIFYEEKMLQLGTRDELRTEVPGVPLPEHMARKIEPIILEKKHRMYEFLIEYKTTAPSEGIYYGCRGITLEGGDHMTNIEQFRHEWDEVKYEICAVLNNTFPGKDFSHRFKMTDNANDQTYWLMWITLYEDEDINLVGMRAIRLIRLIMQNYLDNPERFIRRLMPEKNTNDNVAFTKACYDDLFNHFKITESCKKEERRERFVAAKKLFESFIHKAEMSKFLCRVPYYECAWQCTVSNAEFARMMYCLFQFINQKHLNVSSQEKTISVPWAQLVKVFLDKNGLAFDQNIRTQVKAQGTCEEELLIDSNNKLLEIMRL